MSFGNVRRGCKEGEREKGWEKRRVLMLMKSFFYSVELVYI